MGSISFTSNAPLETIKATSVKMKGLIDESKKTFSFIVPYRSFEGFNSETQREHFNEKYMESEKYPEAIFNGIITDAIDFSKNGIYTVNAKGKLIIHGVERERTIKATLNISNDMIHIESKFNVLLEDHNIKIERVVTQKIATDIVVEMKADLKRKTLAQ
jgi:polyisoprenoid-binding protein YceI